MVLYQRWQCAIRNGIGLLNDLENPRKGTYVTVDESRIFDSELKFRPIRPKHIQLIRSWRNSALPVLRQNSVVTAVEQRRYFETSVWPQNIMKIPSQVLYLLEFEGEVVGYGGIVHISWTDLRGEVSFLLRPELEQDSSSKAEIFKRFAVIVAKLAFNELHLEKLSSETFMNREEHIAIMEDNMFIREGHLRGHVLQNGVRVDSILHGLFPDDKRHSGQ